MGLFGDCDAKFFECVAQEYIRLSGTTGYVFQLIKGSSTRDPYYDETTATEYKKDTDGKYGIKVPLFFKAPQRTGITGEEGYRMERTTELFISKKDAEAKGITKPVPGDIIYVWGLYFDVVVWSKEEAYVNDTPGNFSEYKVDVVHRTKAPPQALWVRNKTR